MFLVYMANDLVYGFPQATVIRLIYEASLFRFNKFIIKNTMNMSLQVGNTVVLICDLGLKASHLKSSLFKPFVSP